MHSPLQVSPGGSPPKLVATPAKNKIMFIVNKYETHAHKTKEYSFNKNYAIVLSNMTFHICLYKFIKF